MWREGCEAKLNQSKILSFWSNYSLGYWAAILLATWFEKISIFQTINRIVWNLEPSLKIKSKFALIDSVNRLSICQDLGRGLTAKSKQPFYLITSCLLKPIIFFLFKKFKSSFQKKKHKHTQNEKSTNYHMSLSSLHLLSGCTT